MKKKLKIYGSDEDLYAFEKIFKEGGFDKCKDDLIQSSGIPIAPSIKYDIVPGIGNLIKNILLTRHQSLVDRQEKIMITGNLPVDEIERLIEYSHHFDIEKELNLQPS